MTHDIGSTHYLSICMKELGINNLNYCLSFQDFACYIHPIKSDEPICITTFCLVGYKNRKRSHKVCGQCFKLKC
jgi:hypothetical protein